MQMLTSKQTWKCIFKKVALGDLSQMMHKTYRARSKSTIRMPLALNNSYKALKQPPEVFYKNCCS